MLGYTAPNNDVHIFFENNDLEMLESKKIQGVFINFSNPEFHGILSASINNDISDRVKTPTKKNEEGYITELALLLREEVYQRLIEKKTFEEHEGFRHVCLNDVSNLGFYTFNYNQCKFYRDSIRSSE